MNRITATRARLDRAIGLPSLLDVAYDAFEDILAIVRCHQERAEGSFAAFVLSAAAAGNGRDWLASAPPCRRQAQTYHLTRPVTCSPTSASTTSPARSPG